MLDGLHLSVCVLSSQLIFTECDVFVHERGPISSQITTIVIVCERHLQKANARVKKGSKGGQRWLPVAIPVRSVVPKVRVAEVECMRSTHLQLHARFEIVGFLQSTLLSCMSSHEGKV